MYFPCFWCLPPVGEVGLEASASFLWEGPVPAHWWVVLGPGPLVGKAMSRGVSIGSCGLRKSLGSLSAGGRGCVPAQLVVWPEASHPALAPTGYWVGPGLGANEPRCWLPAAVFMRLNIPKSVCHQCLCLQGEPQLPPPPFLQETLQDQQSRSGPGFYQITAFILGPSVYEILYAPLKSEVSISPSFVRLLKLSPTGLQS